MAYIHAACNVPLHVIATDNIQHNLRSQNSNFGLKEALLPYIKVISEISNGGDTIA